MTKKILFACIMAFMVASVGLGIALLLSLTQNQTYSSSLSQVEIKLEETSKSLSEIEAKYEDLSSQDQYLINQALEEEIKNIHDTYSAAAETYDTIAEFRTKSDETDEIDELFASSLNHLSDKRYASAEADLQKISQLITEEEQKIASAFSIPENVTQSNTPPGSGYSRQRVNIDIGSYLVDIVSADLNSTRVIVDTASDGDCQNDCPVLSLGEYVGRNGAIAGINGSFFCPASYASCAGKTNSFDTLLMNKNKTYFNSDNNVYSTVPVAAFGQGWARFIGRSLDWGRDTGVDAVIANQPLLVSGGNVVYGGGGDPKLGVKSNRSFIAATGSTVYIGVVHNATVAEAALVLGQGLGVSDALHLDSGGSTALWSGRYIVGPGRNIPNAILFVGR